MGIRTLLLSSAVAVAFAWAGSVEAPERERKRPLSLWAGQVLTHELPARYRDVVEAYLRKIALEQDESYFHRNDTRDANVAD